MHQLAAAFRHRCDHRSHRIGVDRAGQVFVAFGLVDRRIGRCVEDDVGRLHRQPRAQHRDIGEVAIISADRAHLGPVRGQPLQSAAKLAVRAGDQHSHANTGTSPSASPRASLSEMIGSSPATGHATPTAGSFHASVCSDCGA